MNEPLDGTFELKTLAGDLSEVRRIYAGFFAGIRPEDWDRPVKGHPEEWSLHETVAHLCSLTGDGLESIRCTLQGRRYHFSGLEDRYQFNAYNRRGIESLRRLPMKELCELFLSILDQTAGIALVIQPEEGELTATMPIYNRPVKIVEAMSIIMFHAGLHHSAQVAEPAGVPPLWQQLPPQIRRRVIGRVLRAFSLLYRYDLAGDLRAVFAFRVQGPGGGHWHVDVSADSATSAEGMVEKASLVLTFRETDVFCQMLTGRLNLPLALVTGRLRLGGDLRLFPRLGSLFSVDARH